MAAPSATNPQAGQAANPLMPSVNQDTGMPKTEPEPPQQGSENHRGPCSGAHAWLHRHDVRRGGQRSNEIVAIGRLDGLGTALSSPAPSQQPSSLASRPNPPHLTLKALNREVPYQWLDGLGTTLRSPAPRQ